MLHRSTSSGATTLTTYAFGSEEHLYSGSGSNQSNTYYYSLGGRLVAVFSGNVSTGSISLTDALGSVLSTFSNTTGSAAVLGNQVYGPYGTQRYNKGSMGTNKGFTGQHGDSVTGLDYYVARYYDPVVGVFLSADSVQGNAQGMNPYGYVSGNPETLTDPTGLFYAPPPGGGGGGGDPSPPPGGGGHSQGHGPVGPCGQHACPPPPPVKHFKPLDPSTLYVWCITNPDCEGALQQYTTIQECEPFCGLIAAYLSLFGADNPEEAQQLLEEDSGVFQQLAEQENVTLDDAVSAKLTSPKVDDQVEGQAGAIASLYSKLIRFNVKYGLNGADGEVDAETPEAIIEAKSGPLKRQVSDLLKKFNNIVTNPDGKPFVIYAPSWNQKQVQTAYEQLGSLDTGQALYVTTSPQQLIEVLEYLQEGTPSL